jgi:allophanate hydrolase
VPSNHFGSFVAGVPAPLGIGSVQLDTGEWVKGFICEPAALVGATEITAFGGWKNYLAGATV